MKAFLKWILSQIEGLALIDVTRVRRGVTAFVMLFLGYAIISDPRLHVVARSEFLPQYHEIVENLQSIVSSGLLQNSITESIVRMLQGYALGCLIGTTVGIAMGLSKKVNFTMYPLLQLVRFTPALAFLPLYILWFGGGEASKVFLIATGVSVVAWVGALHGVKDIPDTYLKAAQVLGVNGMLLLRKVIIPAAVPQIFSSLRLAVATAWTIIVAAELVGGIGLGYLLVAGRQWVNVPLILIGIVSIGLLVLVMDSVAKAIHRHMTRWMKRVGE